MTPLAIKMRTAADVEGLPADHKLRVLADGLDAATEEGNVPRLLSAWAKARKCWCDHSGEELI